MRRDIIFHTGNPLEPLMTLEDVLPGDVPEVGDVLTLSMTKHSQMSLWSSGKYVVKEVGRHLTSDGVWWRQNDMVFSGPRSMYLVEVKEGEAVYGDLMVNISQLADYLDQEGGAQHARD